MAGCPPYSLVVEFSPRFRDILLLTPVDLPGQSKWTVEEKSKS